APQKYVIGQVLYDQATDTSKVTIRDSRHPLEGKEIRENHSAGMYVTNLGLTWNDRVSFVLTEKLQIKRIEFLGVADKQEMESEIDAEEQFDLDFTLMAGALARLLAQLREVLGARAGPPAAAQGRGARRQTTPAPD